MSQRYTDTEKWAEDWYCELGGEYQKLWDYICDKCDNAGVWKPNKIDFETKTKFKVSLDSFFKKVNGDKERIILLENGRWFLPGFIKYQWFNKSNTFSLNLGNKLHISLCKIFVANGIELTKVRGLREVLERSREGDYIKKEDIKPINDSGSLETPLRPLQEVLIIPTPPEPARPPNAPTMQQVEEYFFQQGKTGDEGKKQASAFFLHYEGLGWKIGFTEIFAWRSIASKWINTNNQKQQNNGNSNGGRKANAATTIIDGDKNYSSDGF